MEIRLVIQGEAFSFPPNVENDPALEFWPDRFGREYGFGLPRGPEYWMKVHQVGTFVVSPDCRDVRGFPDAGVDAVRFQDAFFHGVAPWLLQRREWDCLHASAVAAGKGVTVFCGHSGRGKSTLARAWVERGAVAYADDAVPFVAGDSGVFSARLPQKLRLREPAASRFPGPSGALEGASNGPEVRCNLRSSLRPVTSVYCLGVMLPADHPEPAVLAPLSPVEALPLLLGVAHCMSLRDAACNRKMVENYLSLSRLVPVFRLAIARDLDRLPSVLDLLEENQRRHVHPCR